MSAWKIKLLYDGDCPFCRREVEWLQRRDRRGNLAAEDIASAEFSPATYGLTGDEVMGVLHGVKPDGSVVKGMDAVCEAYRAIGLGWLLAPTRWPLLRAVSDRLYASFARNRVSWGQFFGRSCDNGSCAVKR